MDARRVTFVVVLFCIVSVVLFCDRNIARSATETGNVTGNVTGTVVSSATRGPVAGARIALFKKKTSVTSPDETFSPENEIYSDSKGTFSTTLEEGTYSIIASADSEYAFVDNVFPGTDDAKGITVTLEKPGALKGEIVNSLELRGTGSVVVHLIGTAIFQNVGNDGTFVIENIPAGTYTLASYSTFQEEFSPDYRQVTIYPDSVTDLSRYSLRYNGIPIPRNIQVSYDTLHEVVRISWSPVVGYDDFQEYAILRGKGGQSEHTLLQIGYTKDTLFLDTLVFITNTKVVYEYSVRINNKLGEYGQYYGIYTVEAVPFAMVLPQISAGPDQNVDLRTSVTLQGTVFSSLRPVAKMEWKIGSADWIVSADGTATFTTDSLYEPEIINCYFRVTDSTGNSSVDSLNVVKKTQVVTLGKCPAIFGIGKCMAYFKARYWLVGKITVNQYAVWSSEDLISWNLENATPGISNEGYLIVCNDTLYLMNIDFYLAKSYRSVNGIEWAELSVVYPNDSPWPYSYYRTCISFHGKMVALGITRDTTLTSHLYVMKSGNGIDWEKREIFSSSSIDLYYFGNFDDKLIFVAWLNDAFSTYISTDEGETWSESGLWDPDYEVFPDGMRICLASHNLTIANFQMVPGNTDNWAIYRNGKWTITATRNIPLPVYTGDWWGEAARFFFSGNRLIFQGDDGYFKSVTFN